MAGPFAKFGDMFPGGLMVVPGWVVDALEEVLMPFRKVAKNKYKSPSGRTFTKKQVEAYYATGGFKRPVRRGGGGRKR